MWQGPFRFTPVKDRGSEIKGPSHKFYYSVLPESIQKRSSQLISEASKIAEEASRLLGIPCPRVQIFEEATPGIMTLL